MNHVVDVVVELLSVYEELIFINEACKIDELELLELFGCLVIRFDHGCTHVHDQYDTKAED
jgi:hypothetical protein